MSVHAIHMPSESTDLRIDRLKGVFATYLTAYATLVSDTGTGTSRNAIYLGISGRHFRLGVASGNVVINMRNLANTTTLGNSMSFLSGDRIAQLVVDSDGFVLSIRTGDLRYGDSLMCAKVKTTGEQRMMLAQGGNGGFNQHPPDSDMSYNATLNRFFLQQSTLYSKRSVTQKQVIMPAYILSDNMVEAYDNPCSKIFVFPNLDLLPESTIVEAGGKNYMVFGTQGTSGYFDLLREI